MSHSKQAHTLRYKQALCMQQHAACCLCHLAVAASTWLMETRFKKLIDYLDVSRQVEHWVGGPSKSHVPQNACYVPCSRGSLWKGGVVSLASNHAALALGRQLKGCYGLYPYLDASAFCIGLDDCVVGHLCTCKGCRRKNELNTKNEKENTIWCLESRQK